MPLLDRLVDAFAMWTEDRKARAAIAFRECDDAPLDCFGPLPPLPTPPPRSGSWRVPSPRPIDGDRWMSVKARPAARKRRGTAILVPPWKVPRLAAMSGYERLLSRAGHDVWTVTAPRHHHRTAPGMRSGEAFVSPDLPALRHVFEQLVLELRVLAALSRARGEETAMVGLSLGALAAAIAATGPERIDRLALLAPPADLASVFEKTRIGRRYRRLAALAGTPVPDGEQLARMLTPFRAERRRPNAANIFVAVGREDRIALGEGALGLARAWGIEPRLYRRGHLTLLFGCRALRRDLAAFLESSTPTALPEAR